MIVRPFDTPFVVKEPVMASSILTSPSTFPDNVTDPLTSPITFTGPLTSPFTFTGPLIFPFTVIPSIPVIEPAETEPIEPYVVIAPVMAAFASFNVISPSILPDVTIISPITEPTLIAVSSELYPTLPETSNEFNAPPITTGALTLLVIVIPTSPIPVIEPAETEPTEPDVVIAPVIELAETEPTEPDVVIAPVIAAFGAFSVISPLMLPNT